MQVIANVVHIAVPGPEGDVAGSLTVVVHCLVGQRYAVDELATPLAVPRRLSPLRWQQVSLRGNIIKLKLIK